MAVKPLVFDNTTKLIKQIGDDETLDISVPGGEGAISGCHNFFKNGNVANTWLSYHDSNNDPSNINPVVNIYAGFVFGSAFMNSTPGSNTDLEIYINGILSYTWQIRGAKSAIKTNWSSTPVSWLQNGKISVFARKVTGTDPNGLLLSLFFAYSAFNETVIINPV